MTDRLLLSAAIALLAAAPAVAGGWSVVSKPADVQRVSIDRDTISRQGQVASVWARIARDTTVATGPQVLAPSSQELAAGPDGMAYLVQVSCNSRLIRLSSQTIATGQANPLGPGTVSPYAFQPLASASAYAIYFAVCPQSSGYVSTNTKPTVTRIPPPTPRRTSPARNPWPL